MKKLGKRVLAFCLACVMALTVVTVMEPVTAQAATKSITLYKGEAIYFTDYSKVKSVSSSKKSVVTVKKDKENNIHANLYAKKTGKATVTVKTGYGTNKLNVTVKPLKFSVGMKDMGNGRILFSIKNNTKQTFDDAIVEYTIKDEAGNVCEKDKIHVYDLVAGKTVYDSCYYSQNSYTINLSESSARVIAVSHNLNRIYKNQSSNIAVSAKEEGDKLVIKTKNKLKKDTGSGRVFILFYDADGKVVDMASSSIYLQAGAVDTTSRSLLYGIEYDSYKPIPVAYSYSLRD